MRGNNERTRDDVNTVDDTSNARPDQDVQKERGATATEYALLLGLLAIGLMASLSAFGGVLRNTMQALANTVGGWA